jgi:biotin-dependent carboxylase-like uncharacterized protein
MQSRPWRTNPAGRSRFDKMCDQTVLQVVHPGFGAMFQDLGRTGWRHFGIPQAGPMDEPALRAANLLVGNLETAVALEIVFQGFRAEVLAEATLAVTGADLGFAINGEVRNTWASHRVRPGDVIGMRQRRSGARAYLAVAGGFKAPAHMDSASVCVVARIGRLIAKNEVLALEKPVDIVPRKRDVPAELLFTGIEDPLPVRVILGPHEELFSRAGMRTFMQSAYRVKTESDRMAYRLEGEPISHRGAADIISEPVAPGVVQVPQDGMPIVLMADAQVTGGYAKIATVIRADLRRLAQAIPGDTLRFAPVNLAQAREAAERVEDALRRLRRS